MRKNNKPKFVTVLSVAKANKIFVADRDRMAIGKAWFQTYTRNRKNDKARFPWVGKVKEGRHKVRAYAPQFAPEILRFIRLYQSMNK